MNVHLKFAQQKKFGAFSVTLEKNKDQVELWVNMGWRRWKMLVKSGGSKQFFDLIIEDLVAMRGFSVSIGFTNYSESFLKQKNRISDIF